MSTLIEQYQQLHAESHKHFRGYTTKLIAAEVDRLVKETGAKTLLDYGCGKGFQYSERQYHERWGGILPTLYDPGVPEYSEKPKQQFDGVLCCDVMEHIPEEEVSTVLADIFRYAKKFVALQIFIGPSKKLLPDGRNAHLTQQPPVWWRERIDAVNINNILCSTGFRDRR